jgi:hypothetical protein
VAQVARLEPVMESRSSGAATASPSCRAAESARPAGAGRDRPRSPPHEHPRATLPRAACASRPAARPREADKANASLFAQFPGDGVAAMLLNLMAQLRHFWRTALVMATAPLGIPGAAAALLLTGMPFGFVALLGVIALAGMVMRNTLILVDQVRQDLEAGVELRQAIIESTVRRARPVVLTALAAVLAFVPLTLSVFWGPMAVAMIGGLTLATLATLLVVPALYALACRAGGPVRRRAAGGAGPGRVTRA